MNKVHKQERIRRESNQSPAQSAHELLKLDHTEGETSPIYFHKQSNSLARTFYSATYAHTKCVDPQTKNVPCDYPIHTHLISL